MLVPHPKLLVCAGITNYIDVRFPSYFILLIIMNQEQGMNIFSIKIFVSICPCQIHLKVAYSKNIYWKIRICFFVISQHKNSNNISVDKILTYQQIFEIYR